jgi:hypothetical protein
MTKKEMTTQDIVKNSDEIKNMDISWEKMYAILHEAVKSNKYRILRSGNTLFVIKILSSTEAQLNVFNAEKSFKDYIRNIKEFGKAMEKAGYKKLSARGANIQMVNILSFPNLLRSLIASSLCLMPIYVLYQLGVVLIGMVLKMGMNLRNS